MDNRVRDLQPVATAWTVFPRERGVAADVPIGGTAGAAESLLPPQEIRGMHAPMPILAGCHNRAASLRSVAGMSLPLFQRSPLARLALVLGTTVLTGVGLATISAVCWLVVPPIPHDAAFVARYSVLAGFFYGGQPAKTDAFQACVVAAPFLIFAAISLGRKIIARLDAIALRRWVRTGLALHLIFFAVCVRPLFYEPHPVLWLPPSWLLCPLPFPPPVPAWVCMGCVLFALALCFFVVAGYEIFFTRRVVTRLIIAFAVICAPVELYAPSQLKENDTAFSYHLNAMLDALSQSVNGHHLLVDFPHIYGGYIEMLAPVLRLFPRTMAVPLIALAIPTVLGVACWLATAFRLVRHPALLVLTAFGLLGVTYLSAIPPNYCYSTPRTLFPSLGLLLAVSYFRRPNTRLFLIISALAALASVWNLDTGLVLWLAWTLTLVAGEASERAWKSAALHLLGQAGLLALTWASFLLYLRIVSHQKSDLSLLLYFQTMVVKSGYFCVPLIVPSAWTLLVLLYLTGLVVAALAHLRRRVPWRGRMVLMLSLTGIGMFSYYLGRAAESNLICVAPPGILLAGLLGAEMLKRVRRGLLPPVTRWFFTPWAVMIFWWALLFFVQLPVILQREGRLLLDSFPLHPNFVQVNAAFAARYAVPGGNDVFFLSGNSGFYYYLTRTTRPLRIPGNVELLQMRDMDVLIQALQSRRIPKLFAEQNFWTMDMYREDVYGEITQAIAHNYRPAAFSAGGLILYVPKSSASPPVP
jgi:hypothetical protein